MGIEKLIQDILAVDGVLLSLLYLGKTELQHLVCFLDGGNEFRKERVPEEEFMP